MKNICLIPRKKKKQTDSIKKILEVKTQRAEIELLEKEKQ